MKHTITTKVQYSIGDKIKMADRVYTVVGYEIIPERAIRYILAHFDLGACKYEYFYEFEIKLFIK